MREHTQRIKWTELEEWGRALGWLAGGALLGLVVALPYDRLVELPGSTGSILGVAVWAALLGALHLGPTRFILEWDESLACGILGSAASATPGAARRSLPDTLCSDWGTQFPLDRCLLPAGAT